jgi:hypothetical protein
MQRTTWRALADGHEEQSGSSSWPMARTCKPDVRDFEERPVLHRARGVQQAVHDVEKNRNSATNLCSVCFMGRLACLLDWDEEARKARERSRKKVAAS